MNLSLASLIANASLGAISTETGIVSRNIAGANTQGYSARVGLVVTGEDGAPAILRVTRMANSALLKSLLRANADQGGSQVIFDSLTRIEQSFGGASGAQSDTGASSSPAASLARLRSALQDFSATPSNLTAAATALANAKGLAASLNDSSRTTQEARQQADNGVQASVAHVNEVLSRLEVVNKEIVVGSATRADITDKLDERDGLINALSSEMGISTVLRSNNDMVIYTDSGVTLFEKTPRTVTFDATGEFVASTQGKAVYVDGVPVAGDRSSPFNIRAGKIAGLAQIRDELGPKFQRQLDEIARGLITVFSESDQTGSGAPPLPGLFTYDGASTTPPPELIPGLAEKIVVNRNADPSQGGDISRLRDGGISAPGDPRYVYNAAGGRGYSKRLLQLIDSLAAPQPFDGAAGLRSQDSLTTFAGDSIGWLAAQRQQIDSKLTYQAAVVNQTSQALSNATGVNLDEQMSRMLSLENSYQASARLLAAVNSMYDTLFQAMRG